MTPIKDLPLNPVTFGVDDGQAISVERGSGGRVLLSCQCSDYVSDGWCRHQVDLLCLRYGGLRNADTTSRHALEAIVGGTRASAAGRDADRALRAFNSCLLRFDEARPPNVLGRHLARFTDLVSDLAASAAELEDALSGLQRLLDPA